MEAYCLYSPSCRQGVFSEAHMQETCIAPVLTLLDRPGVSAANFHIILCGLLPGGMPTPVGPGLCGMKRAGALRPQLARAMFAQASRRHSANSWTETSRCGGADLLSWRSPLGRGPLFTQVIHGPWRATPKP